MLFYTLFIFALCFFAFYQVKKLHIGGVNKWILPISFSIKVIAGFIFIYIYTEIYGEGNLSGDAGDFMFESQILNDVFYESPGQYFKFLFGFDDAFEASKYLEEAKHWGAGEQALINDNRNILKFHSLLHFISFGNASIHMIIMCFISMIGIIQLIKGLKEVISLKPIFILAIFLFLPSLLFWGSGLLKEPFVILGLGLFVRGLFYKKVKYKKWGLLIAGILFLLGFKPYILLCLIPSLLFYLLYDKLPRFKIIGALSVLFILVLLPIIALPKKVDFAVQLLSRKQYDFRNIGKGGVFLEYGENFYYLEPDQFDDLQISNSINSELMDITPDIMSEVNEGKYIALKRTLPVTIINHGGFGEPKDTILAPTERHKISYINYRSEGLIDVTLINNSGEQLLKNSFEAIANTLFRPYPKDPGGKLMIQSLIEIWGIYALLILSIFYKRKLNQREIAFVIALCLFIISLSLLIGWVTPVLGAIVRYRFPALMAILFISLFIVKIPKRLNEQ